MQGGTPTGAEPLIPRWPGRILEIVLRTPRRWMWLGAGWAALCGAVASGGLRPEGATLVRLPAVLLLADGLLGAVWEALAAAAAPLPAHNADPMQADAGTQARDSADAGDGNVAMAGETSFRLGVVTLPLPTRAERWLIQVRQRGAGAGLALRPWFIAVGMALAVALLLGPMVATYTVLGLLFPLVTAFALGGPPLRRGLTRAVVEVCVPWSLGMAAFSAVPDLGTELADRVAATVLWTAAHGAHFLVAGLLGGAYYALSALDRRARLRRWIGLLNLVQGLGVVLLVLWQEPLLAGVAGLLWLAQLPFQPYLRVGYVRWYLHHTQWFLMAWMLAVSLGVALR